MFPQGSPSLYGGWGPYTLISVDDVSPGLAINSQKSGYAKWGFSHEEKLKIHTNEYIKKKIEKLLERHAVLKEIVVKKECGPTGSKKEEFAWFEVFSVPGWGERFKKNEQVHNGMRV